MIDAQKAEATSSARERSRVRAALNGFSIPTGSDEVVLKLAQSSFEAGDYRRALDQYEKLANASPNLVGVFERIGACHAEMGDHANALGAYRKEMERGSGPRISVLTAQMLHRLGRGQDALETYQRALAQMLNGDPERWGVLRDLSRLLRDGGAPLAADRLQQSLILDYSSEPLKVANWIMDRDSGIGFREWGRYKQQAVLTRAVRSYSEIAAGALPFPETFILPEDRDALSEYAARHPGATYIGIKYPSSDSEAFVVQDAAELLNSSDVIVQRSLEHPMLVGGRAAELRVYGLVTSSAPLRAYIYRSGDVIVTEDVLNAPKSRARPNKRKSSGGRVTPIASYWQELEATGVSCAPIWRRIATLTRHFLRATANDGLFERQAKWPQRAFPPKLFGLDLKLDRNGQPWLLGYRDGVAADCELGLRNRLAQSIFQISSFCVLDDGLAPDKIVEIIKDREELKTREAELEHALKGEFEPL